MCIYGTLTLNLWAKVPCRHSILYIYCRHIILYLFWAEIGAVFKGDFWYLVFLAKSGFFILEKARI